VDELASAEDRAHRIRIWNPLVVPLLLQTPEYTEGLLTGPLGQPTAEALHAYRAVHRQRKQRALDGGLPLRAVLGEGALRARVGSAEVMRAQLEHLLALPSTCAVQILPFDVPAQGRAPFMLLDLDPEPDLVPVVYLEGYREGFESDPALVLPHIERFALLSGLALDPPESQLFLRRLLTDAQ
jgi:hypothetical protein